MMDKIWFNRRLLSVMLLPLAMLYAIGVTVRRLGYRLGLLTRWRAQVPVVIVGNLTVGGNGKTPLVIWLVEQLQQQGMRVGVVARGYGAKTNQAVQLLNEASAPERVGDEPVLIYQRTRAPVAVARRRTLAVQALLQQHALDVIIADDGLQHYALARDFEWVVIDGERRFGNGYWLPAGPLRESIRRLKSVDAIIVNGGRAGPGELAMQLNFTCAINLVTGMCRPIELLQESVAIAGIGHPQRFFKMLEQHGVRLQRCIAFTDHQRYCLAHLRHLTVGEQTLLMTEKDAVKCRLFAQPNWWYLPVQVELSLEAQQTLLEPILAEIKNGSAAPGDGGLSLLSG